MKILYLFSGSRDGLMEKVKTGEYHGNGFWGMLQLPKFGIEADYIELEKYYPAGFSKFLRRYVNNYAIHLPLFWKILSYDIVFTSSAFWSQFVHTLLHIKKPVWVMHDFSIMSLIGDRRTIKQKIFHWMTARSSGIVTLSNDETERLSREFPHLSGHIECIPFGIDLKFFRPQGEQQVRQILAVGFDPDRDWRTIIEAVRGLDIPVIFATRESRIKKLRPLPPNISVRQFSPRELVREYDRSAIVVVPLDTSHGVNDAMGLSTVYEAMAMGKPVVVTKTRATETYMQDGKDGLLIKEGDVTSMRQAIEKLLSDEGLRARLGTAALKYARENLDIDACTEKLAAFFKRIA